MKAQSGLEYVMVFGFSLIVVGLLWAYSSSNVYDTRWDLQVAYATSALSKIAETADVVYIQGSPSQSYISPVFPDNLKAVYINGTEITMELLWKQDTLRNVTKETVANVTGSLSTASGTHKILVRAMQGYVELTEA